jgi:hypothetical protein
MNHYWTKKVGEVVTIPGTSAYFHVVDSGPKHVWLEQVKPPFTQVCLRTDIGVGDTLNAAEVAIDRIVELEKLLEMEDYLPEDGDLDEEVERKLAEVIRRAWSTLPERASTRQGVHMPQHLDAKIEEAGLVSDEVRRRVVRDLTRLPTSVVSVTFGRITRVFSVTP